MNGRPGKVISQEHPSFRILKRTYNDAIKTGEHRETMLERVKVVITLGAIAGAGGLVLAYNGYLEPTVTPGQLPGTDIGVVAIIALVVLGLKTPSYIDRLAWRRLGNAVGLSAGSGPEFASGPPDKSDRATLTGTVEGRPVRARVYNTGGGKHDASTTKTVVETELRNPVDWHAAFFSGEIEKTAEDPETDTLKTHVVDGLTVHGDIPEETAETVATRRVEDAVTSTEAAVLVGDVSGVVADVMTEKIDDETDGMAGTLAKGLIEVTDAGNDGPGRTVKQKIKGYCTDEAELEARIDAVTTVADAVETSGGQHF
jgi:hypothetical protein